MIRSFVVLTATCAAACALAADPAPAMRAFKVVVGADSAIEGDGMSATLTANTEYQYSWKTEGKERTLLLRNMSVKAKVGDDELMDIKMSRAGLVGRQKGQEVDKKFDDAPDELKTLLRDTFGSPLCKLEVDETGKEVKRTILAKPGAKVALDTGMIANATLFHPPYFANKDQWHAKGAVSAGQGEATGTLTFKKAPGGKGGQLVKLSGTPTADNVQADNGMTVKGGKYVVTGTQTYDTERKEWIAGKHDMDITFRLFQGENELATAKGKMIVTFELIPDRK